MTHLEPAPDPPSADRLVARLDELLDELAGEVADCTPVSDAVRIDRIARLEKLRAVTAALQLAETVRFGQSQTAAQLARKVHPREIGAGIADQVGLACGLSAFQGGRRLGAARALWFDLPQTFAALTAGDLSERVAEAVVHETRHLEHDLRQQVDAQVITAGITEMGLWAATACAKKYAYEADRAGYVERGRTERKQRRVTLRPAPDTMSFLTGHLPVEQGVACLAALKLHTDARKAVGDARTRGQIMADTLVERITGQAAAADVNVEVQIILPAELLTDPASNRTAIVHGYGPIPGGLAKQIIDASRGRKTWREIATRPSSGSPEPESPSLMEARIIHLFSEPRRQAAGNVVGIGKRVRRFTGKLAELVRLRDQTCRMPYCDAQIRHLDHIIEYRHGGQTNLTNGQGLCERHNYLRSVPGWRTDLIHRGLDGPAHETIITTPTGHQYRSRAPDPP